MHHAIRVDDPGERDTLGLSAAGSPLIDFSPRSYAGASLLEGSWRGYALESSVENVHSREWMAQSTTRQDKTALA